MFTGLIEKIAKVKKFSHTSNGAEIFFEADFDDVKIGDSIAINGVCLTMEKVSNNNFKAFVMNQTLNLTNLKNLKSGDMINLERAMKLSSRLDGHIVLGHIDCTASVSDVIDDGKSKKIKFNCDTKYLIERGSIAINGVSLTICEVLNDGFCVSLIPTTIENTNLKDIKKGDLVNIEFDFFAKYVYKFINNREGESEGASKAPKESNITLEFLKQNGF